MTLNGGALYTNSIYSSIVFHGEFFMGKETSVTVLVAAVAVRSYAALQPI